jgi:hypothetical protein
MNTKEGTWSVLVYCAGVGGPPITGRWNESTHTRNDKGFPVEYYDIVSVSGSTLTDEDNSRIRESLCPECKVPFPIVHVPCYSEPEDV